MHRIDHATASGEQFTEGNPGGGTPATIVTADWLNDVQENIVSVIEDAGTGMTKGEATDLSSAIAALIAASAVDISGLLPLTGGTATGTISVHANTPILELKEADAGDARVRFQMSSGDGQIILEEDNKLRVHGFANTDIEGVFVRVNGADREVLHEDNIGNHTAFLETAESGPMAITIGTDHAWAHGLSGRPHGVTVIFECITAENGWSVGDEVMFGPGLRGDSNAGHYTHADASTVTVGVYAGHIAWANKSNRIGAVMTPANWQMKIRAWR